MRNLKLIGVKDTFVTMKGSSSVHKKMSVAFYLVPCFVFTCVAFSSFVSNSFGIYLKYQALIDSYHQHKLDTKYEVIEVKKEKGSISKKQPT